LLSELTSSDCLNASLVTLSCAMYGSIEIKTAALYLVFHYLQYEVLTLDQMSHYTIEKMFPFIKNDKALWVD